MKKSILVLALLAIVATGAFAQGFSLSAGGGLLFDYSLNNGLEGPRGYIGFDNLSFGGFGFFDATYAELDVSFAYGSLTKVQKIPEDNLKEPGYSELQLCFTLLGKFPIGLGSATLSPLLGANYNLVLSGKYPDGRREDKPGESNQFGLLAGVGLDFNFSRAVFLRTEAMFNLRFPSKSATDEKNRVGDISTTFGMGPRFKIGVGFKFVGATQYMLVNADTLNVRSKPSADSSVVGVVARETRVEVLEKSGTWWKIRSGTIQGYVNSAYLKAE
jgi:outer membrane protein W